MSDLAAALMIAIRTHAAQTDRQGEPYLLHVLRVVEAVSDEAKVVAALHDVLEDGPSADAGAGIRLLDREEVSALQLLTRCEDQTYAEYIDRIATSAGEDDRRRAQRRELGIIDLGLPAGQIAREVKLADLRDNLGRIPAEPADDCSRCEGSGTLTGCGCGYCSSTGYGPERIRWHRSWASLKVRYERALASLEGSQR